MKNNTTTLHDKLELNNSAAGCKAMGRVWKLGLDVDLRYVVAAMQCGRGSIGLARKFLRAGLIAWVKEKTDAGQAVFTVYECCGFGYTLHEELVAAGAHCIVATPMRLNLERRRKERSDGCAGTLCAAVALSRWAWRGVKANPHSESG